ncbi:hydantoinase B/oxoprolinase family protein [Egibacter rhizosphaerae]|uniref:Hydantoinase B/oxoprolinase family protein n=1 Tax=Egibacter rhizosphaerae TaxID=1670831 RepID=A0A411YI00_9ACTN|nr:hydantoinase B/oxoprolinase family protein [Egibacter rhizosphaerae]QBI20843.1 hydantoinase B/oxoprolinase family protein [Egibacter rhizosphaerae]
MNTVQQIDPVRVEVVRHALIAAAEEMKTNLMRTAYNPIIYEVLDFSCGVFDRAGRMVAQADGLPIFLGNLAVAVQWVVHDVGVESLRPGDVFLMNDPYLTGNHLNDVAAVAPVFSRGGELLGFTSTRAHWLDIGGKDPGGSIDSTDVVQEGLWFRSVQVLREGRQDEHVTRLIEHNIRYTKNMMGDLRAQTAAALSGAARVAEIFGRHGRDTVESVITVMHRQGEQRTRQAISDMRDGVYRASSCLDDDCLGNGPLPVEVTAQVHGDQLHIDLQGSHAQNVGPVNCGLPATLAACRIALKCLTHPHTPATEGDFAPLHLDCPDDSMFNAQYPAPTFMYGTHLILLIDTIVSALSEAIPERVAAAHYGNLSGFFFVGTDPRSGELYIHQEPENGGWGAGPHGDGESAMIFIADGDTRNIPAEVIETRFPLRLERHELRQDSGGPGQHRGGLGIVRDYRVLDHHAEMTCIMERQQCPPWGLFGGEAAAHCRTVAHPGTGAEQVYQKGMRVPVGADGLVSIQTGGGGGWGPPAHRDPEAVRRDVEAGYVSAHAAERDYHVVLDPHSLDIDPTPTNQRRADPTGSDA